MPQFLISKPVCPGDYTVLSEEEARHVRDVLRIKNGEAIRLFDGKGFRFRGRLTEVSKTRVVALVEEILLDKASKTSITLAQAFLKNDKMEFVLQKAVELGADAFLPFSSSRTVSVWKGKESKIERWRKIAEAAAKQCGRAFLMAVEAPSTFEKFVREPAPDLKILFWEGSETPLRGFFERLRLENRSPRTIRIAIGPEGGFSAEEAETARRNGFTLLSLGPNILRAETAAMAALALVRYETDLPATLSKNRR